MKEVLYSMRKKKIVIENVMTFLKMETILFKEKINV